jgi:hypothetical protein
MAGSRSQHHQHMVVSEIRDATKWLYSYINLNRDAMIIDHGLSGYHIWVSDRGCFRYRIFSGTQQMRGRGVTPMQGNIELPRWPCVAKYLHFRYWPRQLSHVLRVLWVPWTPHNQTSTRHQWLHERWEWKLNNWFAVGILGRSQQRFDSLETLISDPWETAGRCCLSHAIYKWFLAASKNNQFEGAVLFNKWVYGHITPHL